MTRYRPAKAGPPRATAAAILDVQQDLTIRHMLAHGATETPIGPNTVLRLPSGGFGTFPASAVDRAKERMLAARQEAAGAAMGYDDRHGCGRYGKSRVRGWEVP